ncbi:CsbD family protein [Streptomyces roseolus]|uniref:CsbD family protein n=1 Tax=Streptomyces roseolus TaxID=67358 RepID=UPI0037A31732
MGKSGMQKGKGKGKVKETLGKATGNERMKAEGKAEQAEGKVQESADKARDAMKRRSH